MGQSGFDILDSDQAMDVYYTYFEKYNAGKSPEEINRWFEEKHSFEFQNRTVQDCSGFWLGLALAQWETKALTPFVLERVTEIVHQDTEKEDWEENYPERKKYLQKFLAKISKEKKTAKKPVKQKLFRVAFEKGDVITYPIYDLETKEFTENWGLSVCVAHSPEPEKFASSLFISSGLEKSEPATMEDYQHAYALAGRVGDKGIECKSMHQGVDITPLERIRKIGKVEVTRSLELKAYSMSLSWIFSYAYNFIRGAKHDTTLKMSEAVRVPVSAYSDWIEKIIALNSIKYDDPRRDNPEVYKEVADFLIRLRKDDEQAFRKELTNAVTQYLFTYPDKVHYLFRGIVKSAGYSVDSLE